MAKHRNFLRETFLDLEEAFLEDPLKRYARRMRRRGPDTEVFTLRFDSGLRVMLDLMAKNYGVTTGHVVNRLLEAAIRQWSYDYRNGRVGGKLEIHGADLDGMRRYIEEHGEALGALDPDEVQPGLSDLFEGDT